MGRLVGHQAKEGIQSLVLGVYSLQCPGLEVHLLPDQLNVGLQMCPVPLPGDVFPPPGQLAST